MQGHPIRTAKMDSGTPQAGCISPPEKAEDRALCVKSSGPQGGRVGGVVAGGLAARQGGSLIIARMMPWSSFLAIAFQGIPPYFFQIAVLCADRFGRQGAMQTVKAGGSPLRAADMCAKNCLFFYLPPRN